MITAEDIERFGFRTIDEMMAVFPASIRGMIATTLSSDSRSRPARDYNNRILLMLNATRSTMCVWVGSRGRIISLT